MVKPSQLTKVMESHQRDSVTTFSNHLHKKNHSFLSNLMTHQDAWLIAKYNWISFTGKRQGDVLWNARSYLFLGVTKEGSKTVVSSVRMS